jgi:hypothetical protein
MKTRKLLVSVLILVCILLSACAPAAQATPPAPTVIPPTVISPTQSLTTFTSKVYKLHMAVSFKPTEWHISDDYIDLVTVDSTAQDFGVAFNIVTNAELADPTDGHLVPFPEDFVGWIKSDPDFNLGDQKQVTVSGINGLQIDATPIWKSTTTNKKLFLMLRLNGWNIVTKPERWRFIVLDDVNGERLLILLIAPADQFNDAVQQAQAILDSVVFTK